jgi:large subunit ribosomal protein L18
MQKKKKLFLQEKKRYLKKIIGTSKKPRLSVFKSHKHIYAQLIDDKTGTTLAFSSTLDKKIASTTLSTATKPASFLVGQDLGEKAIKKQVTKVIFDRGIHPYHGRVQSLAEGARQEGLIF